MKATLEGKIAAIKSAAAHVAKGVRRINAEARKRDESHLFPVNGRFNATERAIRRLRGGDAARLSPSVYALELEREISRAVNESILA